MLIRYVEYSKLDDEKKREVIKEISLKQYTDFVNEHVHQNSELFKEISSESEAFLQYAQTKGDIAFFRNHDAMIERNSEFVGIAIQG